MKYIAGTNSLQKAIDFSCLSSDLKKIRMSLISRLGFLWLAEPMQSTKHSISQLQNSTMWLSGWLASRHNLSSICSATYWQLNALRLVKGLQGRNESEGLLLSNQFLFNTLSLSFYTLYYFYYLFSSFFYLSFFFILFLLFSPYLLLLTFFWFVHHIFFSLHLLLLFFAFALFLYLVLRFLLFLLSL